MKLFYRITLLLVVGCCLFLKIAKSQAPVWDWAHSTGNVQPDDIGYANAVDQLGNVYTTGSFRSTVDFDPGPAVLNLTSVNLSQDVFITKHDINGNLIWAVSFGGLGVDYGYGITVDSMGNVYSIGNFRETVDFDPGPGFYNKTSLGWSDVYVSKFDGSGNFLWARTVGGNSHEYGQDIDVVPAGNGGIIMTGSFDGSVDFDPSSSSYFLQGANGDAFFWKLDYSGNFVWAKEVGSFATDIGRTITSDNLGNIYSTGSFAGIVDFDPGSGTYNLTAAGIDDIYINKLDAYGNFVWAFGFGSPGSDLGMSIAIDPAGFQEIYVTGAFKGTVDFDPDTASSFIFTYTGPYDYYDMYVAKYDTSGDFIWAKQIGGGGGECGISLAVDPLGSGDLYLTGYFQNTVDFDPGPNVFNLQGIYGFEFFLLKLNGAGNFTWVKPIYGNGDDIGYAVSVGNNKDVYVTGKTTVDVINLTSTSQNILNAKLADFSTGTAELPSLDGLILYPNPANSSFVINLVEKQQSFNLILTDLAGKIIRNQIIYNDHQATINVIDLSEGVYLVKIESPNFTLVRRLVVMR